MTPIRRGAISRPSSNAVIERRSDEAELLAMFRFDFIVGGGQRRFDRGNAWPECRRSIWVWRSTWRRKRTGPPSIARGYRRGGRRARGGWRSVGWRGDQAPFAPPHPFLR